jgi:DNA end-binding protein Ku
MHNREHILVIRPGEHGLVAHTMYFPDELQADNEYHTDTRLVGKKELDLARSLVVAMTAEFEPHAFADSYRSQVLALIEAKRNGKTMKARKVTPIKRPSTMEDQLAASLKAMRPVPVTKKRRAS